MLQFAVRGHRLGKIAMHQCCSGDTHYVMLEKEEMAKSLDVDLEKDLKMVPVKYTSVLFFNNCIPHRRLVKVNVETRLSTVTTEYHYIYIAISGCWTVHLLVHNSTLHDSDNLVFAHVTAACR